MTMDHTLYLERLWVVTQHDSPIQLKVLEEQSPESLISWQPIKPRCTGLQNTLYSTSKRDFPLR
jgi:hypothetical protein